MATKRTRKKARQKAASDGFLTHGAITLGIGTLGLLVAFALIWWQVIVQPQNDAKLAEQSRLLNVYTQLFNGRVADLRATVDAMATAPETIAALTSFNPIERQTAAAAMVAQHAYVSRVDIIEKGKAEVDLSAEVPVSFAALDLIRRAETRQFVGPEAGTAQGKRLYAAQPITPDGSVAGVLLVVFEPEFLLDPLQYFTNLRGSLQILQTIEGTPTTTVLEVGSNAGDLTSMEQDLFIPHWKVAFAAAQSEVLQADNTAALFTPFALALALLFGGTFLGFTIYNRKVKNDAVTLTDYVTRIARGRSANPGRYQIGALAEVAAAVAVHDKNPAPAPTRKKKTTPEDTDDSDLLEDLDEDEAVRCGKKR